MTTSDEIKQALGAFKNGLKGWGTTEESTVVDLQATDFVEGTSSSARPSPTQLPSTEAQVSSVQASTTPSTSARPPPTTNPADLQDEYGSAHPRPIVSTRPLILYAYSETESARINLEFFIAHGLHAAADFVFILNGPTDAASIIPVADNIRHVQRANDCYDLGAYAEVLTRDDLYKGYKKFVMLNASIRGPFIPYWAEACWTDMYLKKITSEVKVGSIHILCFDYHD